MQTLITAGWWVLLTLPLLKRYRQVSFVEPEAHPFVDSFRRLGRTLGKVKQEKHIFLYLLAFFFFIDGVYTIISMATTYGQSLGLSSTGLLLALLVTQIVAFPFSILFGRLSAKYDTGLLIKVCILCYTGISVFAMFLFHLWQFWLLAVMVGMFWALVRLWRVCSLMPPSTKLPVGDLRLMTSCSSILMAWSVLS